MIRSKMGVWWCCVAMWMLSACGEVASSTPDIADALLPDGGTGADMAFIPAPHPALPQITSAGGPVLKNISIVTITWAGDPLAAQLSAFDAWLPTSHYWTDSLGEYGVGAGAELKAYVVPGASPATLDDSEVQKLLKDAVTAGTLPAPNANLLYAVYPPAGTSVTMSGSTGCSDFQAYHGEETVASPTVPAIVYTVTPRCASAPLSALDYTTWGASHELAEAATDPRVYDAPAYNTSDPGFVFGDEVGDLCVGYPLTIEGHFVSALWSNKAAASDGRACVPAPVGPGIGSFATPTDLTIAAGSSGTAMLTVYSTAALDKLSLSASSFDPRITISPKSVQVKNGDVVPVTVTLPAGFSAPTGSVVIAVYTATPGYHAATYLNVIVQ